MRKILFITCSRIGDAVLTTGVLDYILKKCPKAKVTIAVDPLCCDLFLDYPSLEKIILFKKQKRSQHWFFLWKRTYQAKWDWVIDLRGSLLSFFLRTKKRTIWRNLNNKHKVEQLSNLLEVDDSLAPCLWFKQTTLHSVQSLIPSSPFLAVAPTANWVGKQWALEKFIELFKHFFNDYGCKILVFAAPHEEKEIKKLWDFFPPHQCVNMINQKLTLLQVAACLKQATVFLGHDSGLSHIAVAVSTPSIVLFGPSDEKQYGPWNKKNEEKHVVVRGESLEDIRKRSGFSYKGTTSYMESLSVKKVWNTLREKWKEEVFIK